MSVLGTDELLDVIVGVGGRLDCQSWEVKGLREENAGWVIYMDIEATGTIIGIVMGRRKMKQEARSA